MRDIATQPAITAATTLAELDHMPAFRNLTLDLCNMRPASRQHLEPLPACGDDPSSPKAHHTLGALRRIAQRAACGKQVRYPVWSPDEIAAEPSRAQASLLFFPACPARTARGAEHPFVVICSGGGYRSVCNLIEGIPFAQALNEAGYDAFVLTYRVRQNNLMPKPIEDLAQALREILAHHQELGVAASYALAGFSAGGHLVAELATDNFGWKHQGLPAPQAMVLCYPLLEPRTLIPNAQEHITAGILQSLTAGDMNEKRLATWSIPEHALPDFPPTYLWQCADDTIVPVENSRLLRARLEALGVPYTATVFPSGDHGLTGPHDSRADTWWQLAIAHLDQWCRS